jgi:hypothetical protein
LKIYVAVHWWPIILAIQEARDQKDFSSKPMGANISQDPISKKSITKIALVQWLKV